MINNNDNYYHYYYYIYIYTYIYIYMYIYRIIYMYTHILEDIDSRIDMSAGTLHGCFISHHIRALWL